MLSVDSVAVPVSLTAMFVLGRGLYLLPGWTRVSRECPPWLSPASLAPTATWQGRCRSGVPTPVLRRAACNTLTSHTMHSAVRLLNFAPQVYMHVSAPTMSSPVTALLTRTTQPHFLLCLDGDVSTALQSHAVSPSHKARALHYVPSLPHSLCCAAVGSVPAGFDSFGSLSYFDVGYNQLSGPLLASSICSGGFTNMEQLRMSHNNFTDIPTGESSLAASLPVVASMCGKEHDTPVAELFVQCINCLCAGIATRASQGKVGCPCGNLGWCTALHADAAGSWCQHDPGLQYC